MDSHRDALADRLVSVDERIASSARAAGRRSEDITRIVVTKFHPAQLVRDLHRLGVRDVGENRQQEYTSKTAELSDLHDLRWHFIGQIQSKKARAVRSSASAVHSVDREKIADALARAHDASPDHSATLDVLIQVNLTEDSARGGVSPEGMEALALHILEQPSLGLRGVMAVAPLDEAPAAAFARLAGYHERLRSLAPHATWMSAGMTNDFDEAIIHGATHLRIGSAITGARPVQG